MGTIFVVLTTLSLYHFLFEYIIAYSERKYLKIKLGAIKDEIFWLRKDAEDVYELNVYNQLDSYATTAMKILSRIGLIEIIKINLKSKNHKAELRKNAEVRQIIHSIHNEKVSIINENINRCVRRAFMVNLGGWFPYISIPLIITIAVMYCTKFLKKAHNSLRLQIERIIASKSVHYEVEYKNPSIFDLVGI